MSEARMVADRLTQSVATGRLVGDGLLQPVVTEHHIYYDQVELFGQLGLLPE